MGGLLFRHRHPLGEARPGQRSLSARARFSRFALKSLHVNQEIFSSGKGEGCCASQDDFIEADGLWGRAMRI